MVNWQANEAEADSAKGPEAGPTVLVWAVICAIAWGAAVWAAWVAW